MRGIVRAVITAAAVAVLSGGWGHAEGMYMQDGVYRIENFGALRELSELAAETDGGFSGEVWLMCDIEAEEPLAPIGSPEHMFQGVFDGRGHAISGLRIEGGGAFQGLFGCVGTEGQVKNLTVRGVRVTGTRYTGGIAAYSAGTIESCCIDGGRIAGTGGMEYSTATGGIAGLSSGRIASCVSRKTTVIGRRYVGGIVGSQCAGSVEGCVSGAAVRSSERGRALAGGVAGSVQTGGEIRACISAGAVHAPRAAWAGGIAGGLLSGKMSGCISLSRVKGREAGGAAGYAAQHAQIMNCLYAPWTEEGVGEGRQAGVREIEGGRRIRADIGRIAGLASGVSG